MSCCRPSIGYHSRTQLKYNRRGPRRDCVRSRLDGVLTVSVPQRRHDHPDKLGPSSTRIGALALEGLAALLEDGADPRHDPCSAQNLWSSREGEIAGRGYSVSARNRRGKSPPSTCSRCFQEKVALPDLNRWKTFRIASLRSAAWACDFHVQIVSRSPFRDFCDSLRSSVEITKSPPSPI